MKSKEESRYCSSCILKSQVRILQIHDPYSSALELLIYSCHWIRVFPSSDAYQRLSKILSCFIFITLRTAAWIDWKMIKFYFCCFTFHIYVNNKAFLKHEVCILQDTWKDYVYYRNYFICAKSGIDLSSVLTFLNYIERFSLHSFNHDIVKQTGEARINNHNFHKLWISWCISKFSEHAYKKSLEHQYK